ncbi:MAG: hypothetical protein FD134_2673 [Gallionellaceae bacterium]|nr:MAG: hypothetical protein FD134_2673 [Gallionellaceae bacterium]
MQREVMAVEVRKAILVGKIDFYDAYKEWRNRARKYRPQTVVRIAMQFLGEPTASKFEDLQRAPWQVLLLVKWICQDKLANDLSGEDIPQAAFNDLRQKLWELPERVNLGIRDTLPGQLFFRQLIHPQIGFQRHLSRGFVREAALLAQQSEKHPLRSLFEAKVGISVLDFLDISTATYAAILDGKRKLDIGWFFPLRNVYGDSAIDAFISCISRTYPQAVEFCRALPRADTKVASEFYEFPVFSRYPFLRTGNMLECWHPAVFYRGIEGLVHSILSEEGKNYIDCFSKLFEVHVVTEAQKLGVPFLDEAALRTLVPSEIKVPDGLLSFPNCNIFIESKAGLFDESVMTVGHSEIFANKTKALRTAIKQGMSASAGLRSEKRAPSQVLDANRDYLLIVTNKELSAGRGTALLSMYPPDTFNNHTSELTQFLPLSNIYVLSIEDFERLISGVSSTEFSMPSFLDNSVEADKNADSAVHFFEQHLDRLKVPRKYSELVENALSDITTRLGRALEQQPAIEP